MYTALGQKKRGKFLAAEFFFLFQGGLLPIGIGY